MSAVDGIAAAVAEAERIAREYIGSDPQDRERGVRVDGEIIESKDAVFHSGASFILQVGKRSFLRAVLRSS